MSEVRGDALVIAGQDDSLSNLRGVAPLVGVRDRDDALVIVCQDDSLARLKEWRPNISYRSLQKENVLSSLRRSGL